MKNLTNGAESQIEMKAISKDVLNHNQILRIFFQLRKHRSIKRQSYFVVLWDAQYLTYRNTVEPPLSGPLLSGHSLLNGHVSVPKIFSIYY